MQRRDPACFLVVLPVAVPRDMDCALPVMHCAVRDNTGIAVGLASRHRHSDATGAGTAAAAAAASISTAATAVVGSAQRPCCCGGGFGACYCWLPNKLSKRIEYVDLYRASRE